ncbi:hypothetical protein GCM10009038_32910 [Salinicola rhizosphaerae]|uniref:Uncharacterized protein n=1 Tax=Salinicola rhizosphaerae TaxID=1443141 RepID=A0ABQ3EAG8_9GAMM|nr:hypothetical protein GCM10009038_32910 [Salinicola rhizosphaerae]
MPISFVWRIRLIIAPGYLGASGVPGTSEGIGPSGTRPGGGAVSVHRWLEKVKEMGRHKKLLIFIEGSVTYNCMIKLT